MAGKAGSDNGGGIVEINVIPLVDIILVVLIIFMVAAPLVMKPKIDINLPKSSSAKKSMQVVLGKQGELFVNNKPVSLDGLAEESRIEFSKNPETTALLVADKGATLEMVTDLVDAIKSGGIKKVAFSIQKKN